MNTNQMNSTKSVGSLVFAVALIACGWIIHATLYPQNPVREVTVEKQIEVEKSDVYTKCVNLAHKVLNNPSFWTGENTKETNTDDFTRFVDHCVESNK